FKRKEYVKGNAAYSVQDENATVNHHQQQPTFNYGMNTNLIFSKGDEDGKQVQDGSQNLESWSS
ncbi:hypothetical protein HAX54_021626, partial [Datura stramonium]|nr:hypothetical protein [Datura stramonium]